MTPRPSHPPLPLAAILTLGLAACVPDTPPYNEVHDLRVLAIRATPPYLPPDQSAEVDALIHTDDPDTPIRMTWSWCPVSTGGAGGFECALDRDELQALVDAQAPGLITIPPYELGEGPTATMAYPLPPFVLQAACEAFLQQDIPEFVELPSCARGFPIQLRLVAEQGDRRIEAVKELRLLYTADAEGNTNPSLLDAAVELPSGTRLDLPAEGDPPTIGRNALHTLRVDLDPESSESFTPDPTDAEPTPDPTRESLAVTWFVQGGDTEVRRTSFIDGLSTFEQASTNAWMTPDARSWEEDTMDLYFVIRDNRGGVGWLKRKIALK